MDKTARADLDLIAQLESERSTLTAHYSELARFVWPDHAVMNRSKSQQEGDKRALEVVDVTAPIAADRCASALMSMTAPSHRQYHRLAVDDEELQNDLEVKRWLEDTNDTLFRRRYAPGSGFAAQYHEGCKSVVVFGPILTFVEDMISADGTGYNCYHSLSVSNTFLTLDKKNRINGMARWLDFTASQLEEKFTRERLPPRVIQALDSNDAGSRQQKWRLVHVVQPLPQKKAVSGFTHASRYSLSEEETLLEERGYRGCPLAGARYSTMPGETYGRSIAMLVLPAIKTLNKAKRDYIVGIHKQVDPPLLAHDEDGVMTAIRAVPGKATGGGVSADGKPLVLPLSQPGRLDWADKFMEDERRAINDAFMTNLFQILADQGTSREQTAYEVSVREVEKAALLSPSTDRINDEYFSALVARELAIAEESGDIAPMPDALRDRPGSIKVTHVGDLSVAQQAEKILGIQRALEVAPLFAEQDPSSVKRVKWADAFKAFAEGVGISADLIATDEEMAGFREEDEQKQMAAAVAEAAPGAGIAAKNFAEAEQIRNTNAAGLGALV
jgi:hypothetical protein